MVWNGLNRARLAFALFIALAWTTTAIAQITLPRNSAQDGIFAPTADVEIDLATAITAAPGAWASTPSQGQRVYDPGHWAVVFRFQSVTIPKGVTVTFRNHPSRAPVVWLVQEVVDIAGTRPPRRAGRPAFLRRIPRPGGTGPGRLSRRARGG